MVVEFPAACPQTQKKRRKENRKTKDFLKEVSMGIVDDSILGCVSTKSGKKRKEKRGKTRDSGGSQHRRR